MARRSWYSFREGDASPAAVVDRAAAEGRPAVLLADVETLAGQPAFHARAAERGLQPLTGLELRGRSRSGGDCALILVALDRRGWEALCRIVSRRRRAASEGRDGTDPVAEIPPGSEGLAVLVPDPATGARILEGREEVPRLPVLLADEPPYRVRRRSALAAPAWRSLLERASLRLGGHPGASLPRLGGPEGDVARLAEVADAALQEARARGQCRGSAYRRRMERELSVFQGRGLSGYLLLVKEAVRVARRLGVPMGVRGSGGASLLLHLLGASPVDPVAEDLLFERFLNPERADLPDVDLEVCSRSRDGLIRELRRSLGPERVVHLATYPTVGRRGLLSTLLPSLGATDEEVHAIRRALPPAELLLDLDEEAWRRALRRALQGGRFQGAADDLAAAVDAPTHLSLHASGIVATERPMIEHGPVVPAPKGVPTLEFDGRSAEWMGLVKLDILGSRALSQATATLARLREGPRVPPELVPVVSEGMSAIPGKDRPTLERLAAGDTLGCAQLETPPVRRLLSAIRIRRREDLAPVLAAVRPGPSAGVARSAFVRRARGTEPSTPPHPHLQDVLESTRGLLLFEDDIIRGVSRVAGVTLAEADRVRMRLQAIQDDPVALRALRARFLRRVEERDGDLRSAAALWDDVERFVGYSFNRAHAVGTATVAWWSAWLRTHAPEAFACAVLDDYGGSYPLRSVAAAFARSGVAIRSPSVRASAMHSSVQEDEGGCFVRLGLGRIRGMGGRSVRRLLRERTVRPFRDLADLIARCDPTLDEIRMLLLSGALDGLPPLPPRSGGPEREAFARHLAVGGGWTRFPGARMVERDPGDATPGAGRAGRLLRVRQELETLRMHPTEHPMAVLRSEAEAVGARDLGPAASRSVGGGPIRVAGVVAASRRTGCHGGGVVHFVTLEDETGLLEVVVPPAVVARERGRPGEGPVTTPGPYLVEGRVVREDGVPALRASQVTAFHRRRTQIGTEEGTETG